jgi:hypothetical protein
MSNEITEFAIQLNNKPLEELLLMMARHGKPIISQMSDGKWFSVVKMRVASEGVCFDVQSDFNCPTPAAAAKQCFARIIETLSKYGVQV